MRNEIGLSLYRVKPKCRTLYLSILLQKYINLPIGKNDAFERQIELIPLIHGLKKKMK